MDTPGNKAKQARSVVSQHARTIQLTAGNSEEELAQVRKALEERSQELSQQREWYQASYDQLSAIINNSPLRVFLVDSQLRIRQINNKARLAFGNGENLIGRELGELMANLWSPLVASQVIARFRHTLETGETFFSSDFPGSPANRERPEYFSWEIRRVAMPDGQQGVTCYIADISPHILAQQALQKSENRKSAILSASLDAIITMNHEGKISDFNPAAENIFGFRRDDILGRFLADLIIPERFRQQHYAGLARYLATGEHRVLDRRIEMFALRADGQEFPVELSISRIQDSNPPEFTATLRDITQRKRAERELLERARLAALRADISTALTKSGNLPAVLQQCAQALVTHLDGAFARIWTFNESKNVLELQASAGLYTHLDGPHGRIAMGAYKIGRIAQHRQPLLTNDVVNDENISDHEWARKEGMVAFAGYPLLLENQVLGVMAMFAKHPLTENLLAELGSIADGLAQWVRRRRAEEALSAAQQELQQHAANLEQTVEKRTAELQEKIGELEAFSYSVSHDMRSPLRAMQGYASALLEDHKSKFDDEARHYLERIHKAAARMDLLVQEVLTYSRIAKEALSLHPVDLEVLIADVRGAYPALHPPRASIKIKSPLPKVLGHEAFLTQIISNLLGNAVKFVAPGIVPEVNIHGEPAKDRVRIWFEDNGIGIDPAHHKRIFEIFGRVYPDKQFEGTGIGLAIVKKAVERMGGRVGVESQLGRGSRFWFTLKRA